jgi:hypothetical protein
MSVGLKVWCAEQPKTPDGNAAQVIESGRGWQIVCSEPTPVELEDIPIHVSDAVVGVAYVVEITLEPLSAPQVAYDKLMRAARRIAAEGHGVVEDSQTCTLTRGTGVKRFDPLAATENASLLQFSWWFDRGPFVVPTGIAGLLDCFSRLLPEALPYRWGEFEPPVFRWDRDGRLAFEEFYMAHFGDMIVWDPRSPVADVQLIVPEKLGASKRRFRSGYLSFSIDAEVLRHPGWERTLRALWHEVSRYAEPFYGDVRILRHHIRSRGRYATHAKSETHPVRSWWWNGVPRGPCLAAMVGAPYADFYPEFLDSVETRGLPPNFSVEDWRSGSGVELPHAELRIFQPKPYLFGEPLDNIHYPKDWPFETTDFGDCNGRPNKKITSALEAFVSRIKRR